MDKRGPTGPMSRRELLFAGTVGGLALLGSSAGFAQETEPSAGVIPTTWQLVHNGVVVARFSRLEAIELAMQVPSATAISNTSPTSPLPGRRKPPSVVLRSSANGVYLREWISQVQTQGADSAMRTMQLWARDGKGGTLKRFRLRNAFPANLMMKALDPDTAETSVAEVRLVCVRIELL